MSDGEQIGRVRAWVEGYVRAWSSNDPAAIGDLFTEDAAYSTEPYSEPWRGREEIVRRWAAGWSARTSPARPSSAGTRSP